MPPKGPNAGISTTVRIHRSAIAWEICFWAEWLLLQVHCQSSGIIGLRLRDSFGVLCYKFVEEWKEFFKRNKPMYGKNFHVMLSSFCCVTAEPSCGRAGSFFSPRMSSVSCLFFCQVYFRELYLVILSCV